MNKALNILVPAIVALTLSATVAGLWPSSGTPYETVSFRGEAVTVNARGLYYWDTVSSAAQMQANDLVTAAVAVPLLLVSFIFTLRGTRRGRDTLRSRLILAGALGFMLYTYVTMAFGAQFNAFFPAYVALFGLSLYALVLVMMSFDISSLPARFGERLKRRAIAGLLFFAALFLTLAWSGRIAAALKPNAIPALENATSMFIQAMDLAIVVPLCVLAGVLLLRKRPWGYLLASVGLVKFSTLGLAVSVMAFNMARLGVPASPVEMAVFPAMALAGFAAAVALIANIRSPEND